jgi:5'(3')-deoxyribonucleotidase
MQNINWPEVIRAAQEIALKAHSNQVDKVGYAYIGHPRRVAANAQTVPLKNENLREAAIAAAWLHDVVEDSDFTAEDLLARGIPAEVVEAVELVSFDSTKTRDGYYLEIAEHPLARAVKIADVADNQNKVRVENLVASKLPFNHKKYRQAMETIDLSGDELAWFDLAVTKQPDRIIYIDMDNVIVDFQSGIDALSEEKKAKYRQPDGSYKGIDEEPGIFSLMKPYDDSVDAVKELAKYNEVYILSTAPWKNSSAWSDKLEWVHRYFGEDQFDEHGNVNWLFKRLIISHHKHLNKGEFLIDDRKANGAGNFTGIHVHFGELDETENRDGSHPDWSAVLNYFKQLGLIERSAAREILDR